MKKILFILLMSLEIYASSPMCDSGNITKLLSDDITGNRHQRFIIKLSSGKTLLIAHNIDLAPKIEALEEGSFVKFCGEFENNKKGGVVHWTHHDPHNRHIPGWIEYKGHKYE